MNNINTNFNELFPPGIPVVFLHAHADDESFLTAGLISKLVKEGRNCSIIYCAASIVEGQVSTITRQNEVERAAELLGTNQVAYLPYCEPQYRQKGAVPFVLQNAEEIVNSINNINYISELQKQFTLISYDKNGGYGNEDHKLLHIVGREYAKRFKNNLFNFFEVTLNRDKVLAWLSDASGRLDTRFLPQLSYWSKEFGLPANEITHHYQLSASEVRKKRDCLLAHRSQVHLDEFPAALSLGDFSRILGTEYYRLVT